MNCARVAASVLAALVMLVVAAAPAGAATPASGGERALAAVQAQNGDGDDQGEDEDGGAGNDPCDNRHQPSFCAAAPEAPAALLYPAIGAAVLIVFLGIERGRRFHSSRRN